MKNVPSFQAFWKKGKVAVSMPVLALIFSILMLPATAFAEAGHGHMDDEGHMEGDSHKEGGDQMMEDGHMMKNEDMESHMKMVEGTGRINKVMADRHMVNISHHPIKELSWPKMRMNFQTSDNINLDSLAPGQEVTFTLQVDEDNNYLIKKIEKKSD